VSNVTIMQVMFYNGYAYNQDLSTWQTDNVNDCSGFAVGANNWVLPKPSFQNCSP